ncbi:PspA/IM30 family protein, partial [Dokdonella sp.]|uniref:PspA/IM30 family protein n=1 Tax=Dokdonella sp. TaxID=2291710 RepID=UPI003C473179
LISRLTRLFRADAHAVLDRLEEPDILLRQAVREMENEVERNAQALKTLDLDYRHAHVRATELETSIAGISSELDLCFEAGNEKLVRMLLRRRLEGERLLAHLGQRLGRLQSERTERGRTLDEQRQCLESMRQKAAAFDVESASSQAETTVWGQPDLNIADSDVDLALLREQQQRKAS